jgi:hypothetical protein
MSIVPKEVIRGFIDQWPKGVATGTAFDLAEYVADRAAQWALEQVARSFDEKERRAYALWKDAGQAYYEGFRDAMDEAASDIRAMIKGGESDGQ